jgi:hypothetical protein
MKVTFSRVWDLSDEHAMSRDGRPVLVNRSTGDAKGPEDLVAASPFWGVLPAARLVAQLAKTVRLNAGEKALVERFVGSLPPR